jgi:serine/threonine protein phosphatase PrpC
MEPASDLQDGGIREQEASFMKWEQLTIQGSSDWNEDSWFAREDVRVFAVMDGATSVTPFRGPNGETGGYLAAQTVRKTLESLSADEWNKLSLKDAVLKANEAVRAAMLASGVNVEDKAQLWVSEIAIVRITPTQVHYAQTGDCMILARYKDGTQRIVTYDQLSHIDTQTMQRWKACVDSGMTKREDIRREVEPFIRSNKVKMNTLEGYSAINGEPQLADFMEYGTINRIQLTDLLLLTDGLFPLTEPDAPANRLDDGKLWSGILNYGLQGYAERLIAQEQTDPDCQKYMRFKTSDDKTAIWLRFEE